LAERTCIVTRQAKDESDLIRFVRGPEGQAVPDIARKLPGRGVWIGLSRKLVAEAVAKRLFSRGFRQETKATEELPDLVARLLRQQGLGYLALARKAGEAVAGNAKVAELLAKHRVRLLVHAAEAAEDGKRKLQPSPESEVETINLFAASELDLAFGRSNVIHAAVAKGGLAQKLLDAARRLQSYEAS
jgi:predicted RNA-binding protein YlxR (DUF448 family)